MKTLLLTLVCALSGCASLDSTTRVWPDATACAAAEYLGSSTKKIEIAKGIWIDAAFEITSKGNGGVYLPGLGVRVYDSHDDGLVFKDWLLRSEWLDGESDEVLDFVVSGVAVRTDEKTGAELDSTPVRGVFRYTAENRLFKPVVCSPEIHFWEDITEPTRRSSEWEPADSVRASSAAGPVADFIGDAAWKSGCL